jgi:hypothetical protein
LLKTSALPQAEFSRRIARWGLILRCTLPVEEVPKSPWVLIQIELHLAVLVNDQLGRGVQDAGALALVLVIQVEFTGCKVIALVGLSVKASPNLMGRLVAKVIFRPVGVATMRM